MKTSIDTNEDGSRVEKEKLENKREIEQEDNKQERTLDENVKNIIITEIVTII